MNDAYNVILKDKAEEITLLEGVIRKTLKENPSSLDEYFLDFLFVSSKRLRPLFVFFLCDFFKIKPNDNIYNLASAIEIMHSAS